MIWVFCNATGEVLRFNGKETEWDTMGRSLCKCYMLTSNNSVNQCNHFNVLNLGEGLFKVIIVPVPSCVGLSVGCTTDHIVFPFPIVQIVIIGC